MEKVYCNKCEKDVIPIENSCPNCGLEFEDSVIIDDNKNTKLSSDNNTIANILKVAGWLIIILGFIGGIILGNSIYEYGRYEFNYVAMFISWVSCGICSLLFFSIAEVIQILHDIRKEKLR